MSGGVELGTMSESRGTAVRGGGRGIQVRKGQVHHVPLFVVVVVVVVPATGRRHVVGRAREKIK